MSKKKVVAKAESAKLIFAPKWPSPEDIDRNPQAVVKDSTGLETVWLYTLGDGALTDWWDKNEVTKSLEAKAEKEKAEAEAAESNTED